MKKNKKTILFSKTFLKNIEKLKIQKRETLKIFEKIELLSINEELLDTKKLSGKKNSFRLRHGNYRIFYEKDSCNIYMTAIKDRKNAYI